MVSMNAVLHAPYRHASTCVWDDETVRLPVRLKLLDSVPQRLLHGLKDVIRREVLGREHNI